MPANELHLASKVGELDECEKFLEIADNKERVNEKDSTGWTPLHWAASRGRDQIVQYLIDNNADATIATEDNWSPVHDAARAGSEKCLRLLKDAGANMYLKTGNGSTALHYAAQYDRLDAVNYLLNLDVDSGVVDVANATGQTALHVAAAKGKEKPVQALLAFNANTLVLDKIGRSAEKLAADANFPAVVAMLQEAAVAQREQQVSAGELALKGAEEAEMYGDKQRQINELAKAAKALALAGDNRAAQVTEKIAALKALK